MDWTIILITGTGFLLAGIVKGATGLGYSTCALPFLVMAMGLKPAMAVVLIPAMTTNVSMALSTGHLREIAVRFRVLYLSMLPGIAVGEYLLLWVSQPAAVKTLGVAIVTYAALALSRPHMVLPVRLAGPLQAPTGFLNGVMTGLTGAQVMPLFPYIMGLNLDTDRTVQSINLAVLIASTILAIGLVMTGIMTPLLLMGSMVAIVPALVGVQIGTKARRFIPADSFRRVVLSTLLLMGASMLAR